MCDKCPFFFTNLFITFLPKNDSHFFFNGTFDSFDFDFLSTAVIYNFMATLNNESQFHDEPQEGRIATSFVMKSTWDVCVCGFQSLKNFVFHTLSLIVNGTGKLSIS